MNPVKKISAAELKSRLANLPGRIVDVREPAEFQAESLPGSLNIPLSDFSRKAEGLNKDEALFVLCRSGMRSEKAAESLVRQGFSNVSVIEGGLQACKGCGAEILRGSEKVWELERQVRFAAGSLVVLGVLFGASLDEGFYALSAFVGAGLMFAAVTNTCGMAMLIARMPWNRKK